LQIKLTLAVLEASTVASSVRQSAPPAWPVNVAIPPSLWTIDPEVAKGGTSDGTDY